MMRGQSQKVKLRNQERDDIPGETWISPGKNCWVRLSENGLSTVPQGIPSFGQTNV